MNEVRSINVEEEKVKESINKMGQDESRQSSGTAFTLNTPVAVKNVPGGGDASSRNPRQTTQFALIHGGRSQRNLIQSKPTKAGIHMCALVEEDNPDALISFAKNEATASNGSDGNPSEIENNNNNKNGDESNNVVIIDDAVQEMLLSARDRDQNTLLHIAARSGSIKVLKLLLKSKMKSELLEAQENGWGHTALHSAARSGQDEAVKLLLEAGSKIDARDDYGFIPLARAAYEGHLSTCEILLKWPMSDKHRSIDIDEADEESLELVRSQVLSQDHVKQQPLHRAAGRGYAEICRLLIKYGAVIDKLDDQMHLSSLMLASFHGHEETCETLIELGADTEVVSTDYQATALFAAVRGEHESIVKILLDKGAKVNHRDADGRTALHVALSRKLRGICVLLLKHGADVDIKDNKGKSSWEYLMHDLKDEKMAEAFETGMGSDKVRQRRVESASLIHPEDLIGKRIQIVGLGQGIVISLRRSGLFGDHLRKFSFLYLFRLLHLIID